jgi:hypothetical protein
MAALAAVVGVTALDFVCGAWLARYADPKPRRRLTAIHYSRRSGFPKPAEQMRGAAKHARRRGRLRTNTAAHSCKSPAGRKTAMKIAEKAWRHPNITGREQLAAGIGLAVIITVGAAAAILIFWLSERL